MKKIARLVSGAGVLVLFATACASCGRSAATPPAGEHRLDILVSATATEPAPTLSARARRLLVGLAEDSPATDGRDGAGGYARVLSAAGGYSATFPLTPRRKGGAVEHGLNRGHLIDENVDDVVAAVAGVHAERPGLDLLGALDDATRGVPPATLLVVSHGLSTGGGLDLRQVGWSADPDTVAGELADRGLLPALTGWRVVFTGLGAVAGTQPPLSRPSRSKLIAYWTAICTRAGGRCEIDDAPGGAGGPASTAAMPVVAVPGITSVAGPRGQTTYAVSDAVLGFRADSAVLSQDAVEYLAVVAARIKPGAPVRVTGFCADPPGSTPAGLLKLSRERARSVADALGRLDHLGHPVTVVGGGVAPGGSAVRHGRFDEVRAARMRRVEITF